MQGISDASLRETVRDFCVNQQFRRDYWIRGVRTLTGHEQLAAIRDERVVLMTAKEDLPTKARGSAGEAGLMDQIYQPIYELLLDYKPHSVLEIETHVASKNVNFVQLSSALSILLGSGVIQTAAPGQDLAKAKARALSMNKAIAKRSISAGDIAFFASPMTGGGVPAQRFNQLFWLAKQNGGKTPADWAAFVWSMLQSQGQALVKAGVTLQGDDNLVELNAQARDWGAKVLPIWTALGI